MTTVCLLGLLTPIGCAGGGIRNSKRAAEDPLGVLSDATAPAKTKVLAVEVLAEDGRSGELGAEIVRETLKRLAWGRNNRPSVRIAAIDELFTDDPHDTARMLSLMLPTENHWQVIEHVCDMAVETNTTELIPALVRSWSRQVPSPPDDERPERAAIIALAPGVPVEKTVFGVFATMSDPDDPNDPEDHFALRTRRAAWTLLSRIDPAGATTRDYIAQAPDASGDPLLADLQVAARQLGAIPLTTEQLDWVENLRKPEHAEFWRRAVAVVATLGPEQREGFELRHIAGVLWASAHRPGWLTTSRSELLSTLSTELAGRRHTRRTADFPDAMVGARESVDAWRKDLVWGDALLLLIADQAISDPRVVRELFEQADHDQRDESTEYGGVLDADPDRVNESGFVAWSFPPRPAQRGGDNRFIASRELLDAGATALFHYHFHAQSHNNGEYAGPGPGDLEYAKKFGRSCLVLTFVSTNALGVDYYQPDGARIDLGSIKRP